MLDRPIFVIGCGRSGTTLLGKAIGAHPAVAYLNEPRDIWSAAMPQTDIWSSQSLARGGRVAFDRDDWSQQLADSLHERFGKAIAACGAGRLCEKLPINAFRLSLIDRVFPDARYVYIERDGLEVAASIAKIIAAGAWFGACGVKWPRLAALAEADPRTRGLAARCDTPFRKGLLEWTLSTSSARRFFAEHPDRRVKVRYEELPAKPDEVSDRIEAGCNLPLSAGAGPFPRADGAAPAPAGEDRSGRNCDRNARPMV